MDCTQFTTEWPVMSGCDVWFVVARGNAAGGVAGACFGIDYPQGPAGVQWFNEVTCADIYFPNTTPSPSSYARQGGTFPDSGGGARLIWDPDYHCQLTQYSSGVQANLMAVYMYAYAPGRLQVTPNLNLSTGEEFSVESCVGLGYAWSDLFWPAAAGVVGFGGEPGYSPCYIVPVERTTWGRLKSQYQ